MVRFGLAFCALIVLCVATAAPAPAGTQAAPCDNGACEVKVVQAAPQCHGATPVVVVARRSCCGLLAHWRACAMEKRAERAARRAARRAAWASCRGVTSCQGAPACSG